MAVTKINGSVQIQDGTITSTQVASSIVIASGANAFSGDQSMGGNKLTNLGTPTSAGDAAPKSYVDAAVVGLLDFKGSTDASGNPNYPAASAGDAYVISVAGKIGGASGKSVDVGDVVVASVDNAGGTEAGVGTSWFVLEHNLAGTLLSANNLSDLASAATARTNLGATTVGSNLFTVSNPSAIRFLKVNADNTVTLRTAAEMLSDLGATGGNFADGETPSGTINGSNTTFTLANTPVAGSDHVYLNGIRQDAGAGNDYTISGATITYLTAPVSGSKLRVDYRY